MANTTNFNWETPDDTDLVKDGAAAIRTLGSAIDTSLVDLKGGTTGQILSKATGTDMDFTWITNDVGDITAVSAGTGISGGGTSGAITITNDMATTITASGDIVVGTGSGTYDNLPIGTTGQVLTADTTVSPYKVKWASAASGGGLTLLSTTTLSGATTTISSISGSYKDLFVVVRSVVNSASFEFRVKFNSATDKFYGTLTSMTDTALNGYHMNGTEHLRLAGNGAANDIWDGSFYITQYASSTYKKTVMGSCVNYYGSSKYANNNSAVCFYDTTAISSLTFSPNTGTFSSGTVLVYGVS